MKTAVVTPAAAASGDRERASAERVILVDSRDRACGSAGKLDAHRDGNLHRAFSILIYDPLGRMLLQRRAAGKYHFAGRWSNACCGHPRPGEATPAAAGRRLREELGLSVPLHACGELLYRAADPVSGLEEHEYLHLFRGMLSGSPRPNPEEIGAWRWMSPAHLRRALRRFPERFTPWFVLLETRLHPCRTHASRS